MKRVIYQEARQVGEIYHFTYLSSASSIVQSNLKTLKLQSKNDYISFTRDPELPIRTFLTDAEVRIAFDGDGLSNKYPIAPFQDPKADGIDRSADQSETEEMIPMSPVFIDAQHVNHIQFAVPEELVQTNFLYGFARRNNIPVIFNRKWLNRMETKRALGSLVR